MASSNQTCRGYPINYRIDIRNIGFLVYRRKISRTNIDIDDRLLRRAQRSSGLQNKKAVVRKALETFVRTEARKRILRNYSSGIWKGDLKAMRRSRVS